MISFTYPDSFHPLEKTPFINGTGNSAFVFFKYRTISSKIFSDCEMSLYSDLGQFMNISLAKRIAVNFFPLVFLAGLSPASAHPVKVEYKLSIASIPAGKAKLFATFSKDHYVMEASLRLTGLAGVFMDGKGNASATGQITSNGVEPAQFLATGKIEKENQIIQVAFTNRTAQTLQLAPPVKNLKKRVPVTEEHRKMVLDPLSAFFAPIQAGSDVFDPAHCRQTIPVFDGSSRHNLSLAYQGVQNANLSSYKGRVLVCAIRYKPVSGHRPDRKSIKYMESNKDIWVWYAPMKGTDMLLPVRLHVATPYGAAEATASVFTYR